MGRSRTGLFLIVCGIRKVFHWQPAVREKLLRALRWRTSARPTPLVLAVGVGLAWAILSVGPSRLASDLGHLIPSDTVTAPDPFRQSGYPGLICIPAERVLEADGMCHLRTGSSPSLFVDDVFVGAQSGLLAFLVIGAVRLLWRRL